MSATMTATRPSLLRAARMQESGGTPVWFMRQAGRYMAEYRAIRANHSILEICAQPELAAEVTLQPVRRFGVDAAILFADILLPVVPMGLSLRFAEGEGPRFDRPVRTADDVARLAPVTPEESLASVLDAIRIVRRELESSGVPLVGFAGAPFTIASYMIEGGSSRNFVETKRLMLGAPEVWDALMRKLVYVVGGFLRAQIAAGAQAVQLFDSWVGALSPEDYRRFVQPYTRAVFTSLRETGVPTIHFGTGTATLLEDMASAGGDVIGLDWRIPLDEGWKRVGKRAVQGNLDPAAMFAPLPVLREKAREVLRQAAGHPGHIFNVGHGLLPGTPVEAVQAVVDLVHEEGGRAL